VCEWEGPPFFLKKKHEYDGVKATGSVVRNPFFTVIYSQVPLDECPRVGVVVGRRIGKAVTRNRLKRITRELVRASHSDMAFGHHCIAYPKVKILRSKFLDVEQVWTQMLTKIGMMNSIKPK
jgi:ribonuclease P protein component